MECHSEAEWNELLKPYMEDCRCCDEHFMELPPREAGEVFEREYLVAQINRFGGDGRVCRHGAFGAPPKVQGAGHRVTPDVPTLVWNKESPAVWRGLKVMLRGRMAARDFILPSIIEAKS